MLVDIETLESTGELSRASGALTACWILADMMQRDQDRKVVFRSYCIRAMLTWCEAARCASLPLESRSHTAAAMALHSEVSGRYINSDEQDMKLNLNFRLVAANKLLEDLIGDQCIAELRDTNVAHDFETTLQHVLGRYLSLTDRNWIRLLKRRNAVPRTGVT